MRLVDGDERRLPARQHRREPRNLEALRSDEEEVELSVQVGPAGAAGVCAIAPRVDALGGEAALLEGRDLVLHERNERAHHEGRAAARDAGELVAEGLAGAGGHDQQHVGAGRGCAADILLIRAEVAEAERGVKEDCEVGGARRAARSRRVDGGACAPRTVPDHVADVALDVAHEGGEVDLAALDAGELGLPLAGHRRALHVLVHHRDESDALLRRLEELAVADRVRAAEERLEDRGARRRRAEAALAHGLRELLLVESAPRRLHRREERAVGETRRRLGLARERLRVEHATRHVGSEPARERDLGRRARQLERLPADALDARTRAGEAIVVFVPRDRREHGGHAVDVLGMPRLEEASADEIVDGALVGREIGGRPRLGRQDGVVIADARVVDEARPERSRARAFGDEPAIRRRNGGGDRRKGALDRAGDVTAVGPRVADQLSPLVQLLGDLEGALRGVPEQPVRMALQLGEIVELRWRHAPHLAIDRLDTREPTRCALHDRLGLIAVGREARCVLARPESEPRPLIGR